MFSDITFFILDETGSKKSLQFRFRFICSTYVVQMLEETPTVDR